MAYRPSLKSLPAGFSGSGSGLSALEQSGSQSNDTIANPSAAGIVGAYRPLTAAVPVNPYASGTPPSRPVGDAAGDINGAASAQPAKAVPAPYQPPALAVCTFAATAVGAQPHPAEAVTPPHLTPTKSAGVTANMLTAVRSPLPGYSLTPPAAVHTSSPASLIPGLAHLASPAQHTAAAELASTGSVGRVSQTGLSIVGLPPALAAAKAVAASGSAGGSRPLSTHPSRGPSSDGLAQHFPAVVPFPTAAATNSQAAAYNPMLMTLSTGAVAAPAAASRSSTPPLAPQQLVPAATTIAVADSLHSSNLSLTPQQQPAALTAPAIPAAPIHAPIVSTAPAPVRPVVSAAAPGAHLPTPMVVGRVPQPVLAAAAPVPIITSIAAPHLLPASGSGHDGVDGDAAARRQLAIQLADMMGGSVDVATCLDVLEQVGGDEGRAAAVLLEMCGAGAGGGGATSDRLPDVVAPVAAAAAEDMTFAAGDFGAGAEAHGFFAAADSFGAAAAGPSTDARSPGEGFLGMAAGFGEAAGAAAEVAAASVDAAAFDFASIAGGSPPVGQGAEHMRAVLEAAGLSCDDEGLAQLFQQQEEIEEQRRREQLQQQTAADEAKVKELQQQEEEARAARERGERERADAQEAAGAAGAVQDAGAAWGSSGTSGGTATQATGYFSAAAADDTVRELMIAEA